VPYLSVAIQSMMENASADNRYRIYVLNANDLELQSVELLKKQVATFAQFSIDFVDVSAHLKDIEKLPLPTLEYITRATYFRFVLPYIFPDYRKMLYLDCDMVVCADIAELYNIELGDKLLAAIQDIEILYRYYSPIDFGSETETILTLQKPESYFNAGVLVFNLDAFRSFISLENCLNFAASNNWHYYDQDMLNTLCEGQIKFLSQEWNCLTSYVYSVVPDGILHEYLAAKQAPKILHFTIKPWKETIDTFCDNLFLKYTLKCPFKQEIIYTMYCNGLLIHINQTREYVLRSIEHTSSLRFILKCVSEYLKTKFRKIKRIIYFMTRI